MEQIKFPKTRHIERGALSISEQELRNFSLVIADIDYTLTDFDKGHRAGIEALAKTFGESFAQEINKIFYLVLAGHRKPENEDWDEREEFNGLVERIKKLQMSFVKDYGIKDWSRETWILTVAEKLQIKLERQQIEDGRDAYWTAVSQNSMLYEDAKTFLGSIKRLKLPLVLMTSSDSVLKVNIDCSLEYDPSYAEQYKRNRLSQLPLNYKEVVIGDPVDKPDLRFFDKLFRIVSKFGDFPKEQILVVGDSYGTDLEVPQKLGYPTFLVKRR